MAREISTDCCIAGGGPAGMMLGLLLARAGVAVVVLEKHADFLRDFRGDTIHPSTLELMHELGCLDAFLELPHQKVHQLRVQVGETEVTMADFSHLPTRCGFVAFLPQWDFLSFLAGQGRRHPSYALRMHTEVTGLIEQSGEVVGVRATGPDGPLEVHAALVVGADGRGSVVRDAAGLEVQALGAPMDVLWFRLSRAPDDPQQSMGRFDAGRIVVLLNRGEHWQMGYVIPKGALERVRDEGLEDFRQDVAAQVPFVRDRVGEIGSWDDVKLLTVRVDRLRRWHRPGLLCIGDAAHAMSPVGGVGINLAVQDAVAAANALAGPLLAKRLTSGDLDRVQRRREFPTRVTQRLQVLAQERIIARVLGSRGESLRLPLALRLLERFAVLRRVPGRIIGIGVRPEHVRSPDAGRSISSPADG